MYTISLVCVLEMIADFAFIADDSSFRAANGMTTAADVPPWGYNVGLVRTRRPSLPAASSVLRAVYALPDTVPWWDACACRKLLMWQRPACLPGR